MVFLFSFSSLSCLFLGESGDETCSRALKGPFQDTLWSNPLVRAGAVPVERSKASLLMGLLKMEVLVFSCLLVKVLLDVEGGDWMMVSV